MCVKPQRRACGTAPRAEMQLVDRDRRGRGLTGTAALHPGGVLPAVVQVGDHGCGLGRQLARERQRVGLVDLIVALAGTDAKLVPGARDDAGHEAGPDPAAAAGQGRLALPAPVVLIADHGDRFRVGGPDREPGARLAVFTRGVRAQMIPETGVGALGKQVNVDVAKLAQGAKMPYLDGFAQKRGARTGDGFASARQLPMPTTWTQALSSAIRRATW